MGTGPRKKFAESTAVVLIYNDQRWESVYFYVNIEDVTWKVFKQ